MERSVPNPQEVDNPLASVPQPDPCAGQVGQVGLSTELMELESDHLVDLGLDPGLDPGLEQDQDRVPDKVSYFSFIYF